MNPLDCDDGDVCTADWKQEVGLDGCKCAHAFVAGMFCNDGVPCSLGGSCQQGKGCMPYPPDPCDDFQPCTADSCDLSLGCTHTNEPDGALCTLPNGGTCKGGLCVK